MALLWLCLGPWLFGRSQPPPPHASAYCPLPTAYSTRRKAFTLVELLVVVAVIALVSVLALKTIVVTIADRQITSAAAMLQADLVGARDRAGAAGRPCGIRLLPDESFPLVRLASGQLDPSVILACDRWIPLEVPPAYSEGVVNIVPGPLPVGFTLPYPCLLLEQSLTDAGGTMASPTSWFWNVRVGDRVRLLGSSREFTVCGPVVDVTPELFVNVGPPGTPSPLDRGNGPVEYLLLVNGQDDNADGFPDNGFDGLDNNGDGQVDEPAEWETEIWPATLQGGISAASYSLTRRPVPSSSAAVTRLPSSIVIDLTTWGLDRERSRLPLNRYTGTVDIMIDSAGRVIPTLLYGVPSSVPLDGTFCHFWLCERTGVADPSSSGPPYLPMPAGTLKYSGTSLEGERQLVTLNARSGRVSVNPIETFDVTNIAAPFQAAQQGR